MGFKDDIEAYEVLGGEARREKALKCFLKTLSIIDNKIKNLDNEKHKLLKQKDSVRNSYFGAIAQQNSK